MRIIFCRHGETEFNLFDRFQGVSDSPLTERGIQQARKLNTFLRKSFAIKKIYISPLERVKQTYKLASYNIDAEFEIVSELRETCFGEWETRRRDEINAQLLEEKELDRFHFVHPGSYQEIQGESYQMTFERVKPFLDMLTSLQTNDDIAVISHQGVMVGVYEYFLNKDKEKTGKHRNSNHHVMIVTITEGKRTVEIRDLDQITGL